MPADNSPPPETPAQPPNASAWSYIGVGCLTAPIGFFGGGMVAVLIAKIVGAFTNCAAPEGLPACYTFEFLGPGALIGLIGLPALSVWRLRVGRRKAAAGTTQGGVSGAR